MESPGWSSSPRAAWRNNCASVASWPIFAPGFFTGIRTALYRWIGEELKSRQEAQNVQAFQPYETRPGEQMKYDWAEYRVRIGEAIAQLFVHLTTLGTRRYMAFDASLTVHQGDVFTAPEDTLESFGGLAERLQVDCTKFIVLDTSSA